MKFRSETVHQKRSDVRFVTEISLVFHGIFRYVKSFEKKKTTFHSDDKIVINKKHLQDRGIRV